MASLKKKGLVLLSGGIDSAVTLWWVLKQGWELSTLTFLFPGRRRKELWATKKLSIQAKSKENYEIPLPFIDSPRSEEACYIPQKNLMYYGVAASLAKKIHADFILGGHHKSDGIVFPDAQKKYLQSLNKLIGMETRSSHTVQLKFPFIELTKEKIIQLGDKLNVPFQYTWSCSKDQLKPCENCNSCSERKKGFKAASIEDPLFA